MAAGVRVHTPGASSCAGRARSGPGAWTGPGPTLGAGPRRPGLRGWAAGVRRRPACAVTERMRPRRGRSPPATGVSAPACDRPQTPPVFLPSRAPPGPPRKARPGLAPGYPGLCSTPQYVAATRPRAPSGPCQGGQTGLLAQAGSQAKSAQPARLVTSIPGPPAGLASRRRTAARPLSLQLRVGPGSPARPDGRTPRPGGKGDARNSRPMPSDAPSSSSPRTPPRRRQLAAAAAAATAMGREHERERELGRVG
jgi:hypothetical protein